MTALGIAIGALIAMALAPPAGAQTSEAKTTSAVLEEYDANGDGRLTRDEAPLRLLAGFSQMDLDGDGAIDRHEAWQWDQRIWGSSSARPVPAPGETRARARGGKAAESKPQSFPEWIAANDRNGDGKLEMDEVPSRFQPRFDRLDADGNGYVDLADAELLQARMKQAKQASATQTGVRRRSYVRTIELMDTNGDGLLQWREAPLALQRSWKTLDENGDGAFTRAEAEVADQRRDAALAAGDGE